MLVLRGWLVGSRMSSFNSIEYVITETAFKALEFPVCPHTDTECVCHICFDAHPQLILLCQDARPFVPDRLLSSLQ